MAEFPDLGQHCGFTECSRLDFLPMRCDACTSIFCGTHITYAAHRCTSSYKKDVQVPVCPLCSQPIPVPRGQTPDVLVGQHIDNDCKSDPARAKRGKIYANQCEQAGCKKRELVPIACSVCRRNFCLRHRHSADHDCHSIGGRGNMSNSAIAALSRLKVSESDRKKQTVQVASANHVLSDDEALARALHQSLNGPGTNQLSPEELDRRLAEQLQNEELGFSGEQQSLRGRILNQQRRPPRSATTTHNSGGGGSGCSMS